MKIEIVRPVVYFHDPFVISTCETGEDEFKQYVQPLFKAVGISFKHIECSDTPPFDKPFEILLFDWGGMSVGNDLLSGFCRQILHEAAEKTDRYFIVVSSFSKEAMKDALAEFGNLPSNVFLDAGSFAQYLKKHRSEKEWLEGLNM